MQLALLSYCLSVCWSVCLAFGTFKHFSPTQYAEINLNRADTLQLQATSFAYYIWLLITIISDSHPNTPCTPLLTYGKYFCLYCERLTVYLLWECDSEIITFPELSPLATSSNRCSSPNRVPCCFCASWATTWQRQCYRFVYMSLKMGHHTQNIAFPLHPPLQRF